MSRVLVVFQHGPYGCLRPREGLDFALAAVAYEHRVRVLFVGAGLELLRRGQDPQSIAQNPYTQGFRALSLHGVEACGFDRQERQARGLRPEDLLIEGQDLDAAERQRWVRDADCTFTF